VLFGSRDLISERGKAYYYSRHTDNGKPVGNQTPATQGIESRGLRVNVKELGWVLLIVYVFQFPSKRRGSIGCSPMNSFGIPETFMYMVINKKQFIQTGIQTLLWKPSPILCVFLSFPFYSFTVSDLPESIQ
jgi:hypothetical protein